MPLIIEGGRVPTRWAENRRARSQLPRSDRQLSATASTLRSSTTCRTGRWKIPNCSSSIFWISPSGDAPVVVKLYSLTGVPRTDRGQRHLNNFYWEFDDLWNTRFDGVIVTGTEPHQPNLRDEPYWGLMAEVFDWAEHNTSSTILSCLAAHASVLHRMESRVIGCPTSSSAFSSPRRRAITRC